MRFSLDMKKKSDERLRSLDPWSTIPPMLKDRRFFRNRTLLLCFVVLTAVAAGCADESSTASSAVFATTVIGEPVVQASETALKMSGYRLTERNDAKEKHESPSRVIHGERYGMSTAFGPAVVQIRIVVTPVEKGSRIQVDIIPPKGAYGTTAIPLNDYQYTLSQLLPGLAVKSKKVPSSWF